MYRNCDKVGECYMPVFIEVRPNGYRIISCGGMILVKKMHLVHQHFQLHGNYEILEHYFYYENIPVLVEEMQKNRCCFGWISFERVSITCLLHYKKKVTIK